MEVILLQNTEPWKIERGGPKKLRIGSSDICVVCGVDKYKFTYSLYDKIIAKIDGTWIDDGDEEEKPPCKHGHLCEPIIAPMYENITGNTVQEANYWRHENKSLAILYGCSPDRKVFINGEFQGLLEIKAPFNIMYQDIKLEHLCQVQYQMWITKKPWCDYMAVKLQHENPELDQNPQILLKRIYYSTEFVEYWMKPRLFYFSKCIMTRTRPPNNLYKNDPDPPTVKMDNLID